MPSTASAGERVTSLRRWSPPRHNAATTSSATGPGIVGKTPAGSHSASRVANRMIATVATRALWLPSSAGAHSARASRVPSISRTSCSAASPAQPASGSHGNIQDNCGWLRSATVNGRLLASAG